MTIAPAHPRPACLHQRSSIVHPFVSDGIHDVSSPQPQAVFTATTRKPRVLPSLPAELHLEIIDILAHRVPREPCRGDPYDRTDLVTLLACSLVCKLWLNTARTGIWTGVRLTSRNKSMAFVRLLRAYAGEPCDATPTWSIPSFGRYVSHLSVRETRGNAWDPKWLDDALPHLAARLPRVQGLEMERVTWEYLSYRSRTACLLAFKQANNLALRGFEFHTMRDMCGFLGEFTELEKLTLDGVQCGRKNTMPWFFDSAAEGEGAIKLPPMKLKEVGFRDVPTEPVLEWIMAGSEYERKMGKSGTRIKSIRMGGVGVAEANVVGRFLRVVGDSLRRVYIGFDTDFVERGDALVRKIELGENANLEELHIFGLVVPSPPPVDPFEAPRPQERALEALTLLLSQIRSRMRVLSLGLYPADLRAMCAVDFEGLSRVFGTRVWSGVDEVRVVVSNKGEYGLGRAVEEGLGALSGRGVLRVSVGFDEREVL